MPLQIFTSNRMENLVDALVRVIESPLSHPLTPEVIVVQSKGMQRWIAMSLAEHFGAWANGRYPFPNTLVWQLFSQVLPGIPDGISPFSPDVLTWKIFGMMPQLLNRPEFIPLRHYLDDDDNGIKRFQLAVRIAETFDQYTLFRPEMLINWENEQDAMEEKDKWQAVLWRRIVRESGSSHRGRLKDDFCRRIPKGISQENRLPERIAIFGISYLPEYYLDVLTAISGIMDVNFFLLSPTREYWADILPNSAIRRMAASDRSMRTEGHPLLASLGKLGRDFSDRVIEICDAAATQEDLYEDPGTSFLLERIQTDILNLSGPDDRPQKQPVDPRDRSIQIHSCHSPMREIEVLHDQMLALLEQTEGLEPRDILVMTPDIETYAPYISAVFDGIRDPAMKIPYSIADRHLKNEGRIAGVLQALLSLPESRFGITQILDVLESPPVRKRFDLEETEVEIIRGWLEETRIRWGIDAESRIRLGLPGYPENSWKSGLDRLLLGYAMPDENGRLFNGILPFDEMEGSPPQTLGKLLEFFHRTVEAADALAQPRTLSQWQHLCGSLLSDFIAADENAAREWSTIADILASVGEPGTTAGWNDEVEPGVFREWFTARLNREEKSHGFMTGGITFCAMLPMRSIPFRVIALIGMNDGAFPRQDNRPGFDLMARKPKAGDRSLRDEDRYLFLESILSARNGLYISYIGQNIRDNSEMPPSVLVSELLDAIGRGFSAGDGPDITERMVTRHRLQAFSTDYFVENSPLFSYSAENGSALHEKQNRSAPAFQFLSEPLPLAPEEWQDIPLAELCRFFDNPARFFLENRLGIRLEDAAAPLEDRELFSVDSLEAYFLNNELLELVLDGGDTDDFLLAARSRGVLPPARHGETVFRTAMIQVEDFAKGLREKLAGQSPLAPLDIDLHLAGCRLTGRLDRIGSDRMIHYRMAKLKAKDQIRSWIAHLVLNALKPRGYPLETTLIMKNGSNDFFPVPNAADILETVIQLFRRGLTKPLPFFPESAMAYAADLKWDLNPARKKWEGNPFEKVPGEGSNAYFRRCFGPDAPLDAEFEEIARTFLEPLCRHMKRIAP